MKKLALLMGIGLLAAATSAAADPYSVGSTITAFELQDQHGAAASVDLLRVDWPDGTATTIADLGPNQHLTIPQP